jgi:hypothetical protein
MLNIPWYNASQDWYKVRVNSLRKAMRRAYDDWKSGKTESLGKVARQRIEELHSFGAVGQGMHQRLQAVLQTVWSGSCRSELAAMWGQQLPQISDPPVR